MLAIAEQPPHTHIIGKQGQQQGILAIAFEVFKAFPKVGTEQGICLPFRHICRKVLSPLQLMPIPNIRIILPAVQPLKVFHNNYRTLKRGGEFADTRYTIRYFQSDGKGLLRNDNGTVFKPNDRYPLTKDVFLLYYTSLSSDRQTIDVYVEDNFGKVQQLTFSFNNEREEGKDKPTSSRR